jgi:ribonuclease Z
MDGLITVGDSMLPYELNFIQTQTESIETVVETEQFKVVSVPLKHRIPCTGFLVKEKGPELKLNIDACVKYKIPVEQYDAIKLGLDYHSQSQGVVVNSVLTILGNKNRTYAYITDTIYDPEYLVPILQNIDLLYHEATFLHERANRAQETHHSTALQAAQIAKEANVKRLVIGHFSARYNDVQLLLDEAKSVFSKTIEAVEGETYCI